MSIDLGATGPVEAVPKTEELAPVTIEQEEHEAARRRAEAHARTERFRPSRPGWAARLAVWAFVGWLVFLVPGNLLSPFTVGVADADALSRAVIFAICGLSLNVLIGYAGQLSLGHQAFVGIGAFTSAYFVSELSQEFWLGVAVAAGFGAVQAFVLGLISLRITGLYFALVTLAYGLFAQESLFAVTALTGGGAGKIAPRPYQFPTNYAYYYVCLAFLLVVLWLDWRLMRSKGGRALLALRENPRVAATYGISVKAYTLLAFVVSGIFAGIAGALFGHHDEVVVSTTFDFELALIFVLMTVVGGLRNRVGVVIGSAFFALLGDGLLVDALRVGGLVEKINLPVEFIPLVIGPILLLLTITLHPGGIGQQVAPVREWLMGRRFDIHAGAVKEVQVTDVRA